MFTEINIDLITKARAGRRSALSNIAGRTPRNPNEIQFRHSPMNGRLQSPEFPSMKHAHQAENIFCA